MALVTKPALVLRKVQMFHPLHYSKLDLNIRYHRMQICSTCCNGGLVGSLSESSLVIIEIGLPVSCKNNSFPEIFTFKNDFLRVRLVVQRLRLPMTLSYIQHCLLC